MRRVHRHSLGDLSGTSGLVSYSAPDATASELMALPAARASSIWLSVNGSWVLYASVNGAIVPGSSDFTVPSGNVLYISNWRKARFATLVQSLPPPASEHD